KTPYSRFGDGRAVLRSCIREYLCSEAMVILNVPTTRALCIIKTNEQVLREKNEPGAILCRLASSHIRFGHFEHFYYRKEYSALKILADHVIKEYFLSFNKLKDVYEVWFTEIVKRTACLIARWQSIGFSHGVLNTDNMSILGLTLDYGPFGFMENFIPDFICNHSDHGGLYAFNKQASIGLWNLQALAFALQPLLPLNQSKKILLEYEEIFIKEYYYLMRSKLGLAHLNENNQLWMDLLNLMADEQSDYTLSFRYLADTFNNSQKWLALFKNKELALKWLKNYHQHLNLKTENIPAHQKKLNQVNPKFILRNWVAELVIRSAEDQKDYSLLDRVFNILQKPYDEHPSDEYLSLPTPTEYQNLCVSCSS
ncbi:MAG: hypothetical protein JWM09_761, partial [Francisellaceae bacterium]|nr:hypothetical protein [Francisellaceae bacterium]